MSSTAQVPENLTYVEASRFTLELQNCFETDELSIDFSKLRYSWPLAMLMLGASIRRIVRSRKESGLRTKGIGVNNSIAAHSYLEHLGFFDFIGLPDRNKIGTAQGNDRYIPIRKITRDQFETKGRDSKKVRDEILAYSDDLACVLAGQFDDYQAKRTLAYAFKETIRNVFEHAEANSCFLAGQRWADGKVEVAVVDEGRGVLASLREAYEIEDDAEALRQAIKPGISRAAGIDPNEHDNSGFGLYVLSEVGRNFGRFVVGSGDAALRLRTKNPPKTDDVSFKGTFAGLRLTTPPTDFASVLEDIVQAGEEETGRQGQKRKASTSSKEF